MLQVSRSNKGYTLIEVMVALVVFSFVAIIFATSVPLAIRSSAVNEQYAQAISLCQHKIDQMRAVGYGRLNYDELADASIIDDAQNTQPYTFAQVDEISKYLPCATATITIAPPSGTSNQLLATVTITWKNNTYNSKTSSMSLRALIANVE